ncbi:sigma-70 family RNA polymerase sigma factor [Planctomycetales bacterium ZRK34]|nr:sigma-70 family RNA polymerase sigma factor [Planctomycetales bacterium ZRK34]
MAVNEELVVRELWRQRIRLLAYIEVIVRDRDLAEDVFQEIGVAALTKRDQINDREHLVRWLGQAARYHGLTAARNRSRHHRLFDSRVLDHIEAMWQRDEPAAADVSGAALETCLGQLTGYNRKLIELRYRQGLTGSALAEAAGRSKNTVYVALARVHKALAECVTRELRRADGSEGASR